MVPMKRIPTRRREYPEHVTKVQDPLLGTRAEVSVLVHADADATSAEDAVFAEVARLESIFTLFDETSALHALRLTGQTEVPELVAVRDLAEHWRERTSGAFNPGIARLTSLWENAAGLDTLPSQESLRDVLDLLAQDRVADLDFNGIAKGWIADTALASSLDAEPDLINAAWLNIGGDLVHRGVGSLVVGIEDPARPYDNVAPMATVEIANEALATSGGARRWWDIDGKRYSKVLDPRTGLPVDRVASATVVAADAATADVLATVALVLDPAEMLSLIEAEQAHCFVVLANGSTITSSNRFTQS